MGDQPRKTAFHFHIGSPMPNPGRTPRRKSSLPKLIEKYYADLADLAFSRIAATDGSG